MYTMDPPRNTRWRWSGCARRIRSPWTIGRSRSSKRPSAPIPPSKARGCRHRSCLCSLSWRRCACSCSAPSSTSSCVIDEGWGGGVHRSSHSSPSTADGQHLHVQGNPDPFERGDRRRHGGLQRVPRPGCCATGPPGGGDRLVARSDVAAGHGNRTHRTVPFGTSRPVLKTGAGTSTATPAVGELTQPGRLRGRLARSGGRRGPPRQPDGR